MGNNNGDVVTDTDRLLLQKDEEVCNNLYVQYNINLLDTKYWWVNRILLIT